MAPKHSISKVLSFNFPSERSELTSFNFFNFLKSLK